jgi:formylglycine-generating enzyme required for sulfatase activity
VKDGRFALAIVLALLSIGGLANTAVGQGYKGAPNAPPWGVTKDCADCPEMVSIPSGTFVMGAPTKELKHEKVQLPSSNWAQPQHPVRIGAFSLGRYHVTRGQYAAFVAATGRATEPACWGVSGSGGSFWKDRNWRTPGFPQTDEDPVVCVSWDDAQAYVKWLSRRTGKSYRLPAEAEWEYATRAGTTTTRYWGDGRTEACRYANVADLTKPPAPLGWGWPIPDYAFPCTDGYFYTSPVGKFEPNPWGLYDMLGNADQWTADCWNPTYSGAPKTGTAWLEGDCGKRMVRGGSWKGGIPAVRSAWRSPHYIHCETPMDARCPADTNGFRVASGDDVVAGSPTQMTVAAAGHD